MKCRLLKEWEVFSDLPGQARSLFLQTFFRFGQVNRFAPQALVSSPVKATDSVSHLLSVIITVFHGIGVSEGSAVHFGKVNETPFVIGTVETIAGQVYCGDLFPGKVKNNGTVLIGIFLRD